jgi:hypothetical protein
MSLQTNIWNTRSNSGSRHVSTNREAAIGRSDPSLVPALADANDQADAIVTSMSSCVAENRTIGAGKCD